MRRARWSRSLPKRGEVVRTGRNAALGALLAMGLLVGCADPTGDDTDDARPPLDAPSDGTQDGGATDGGGDAGADGTIEAGLEDAVAVAVADAAGVAGVSEDAVTVLVAEAVTWSDGSLGCPEPGMAYTQALVDGYRIELEVGGESVAYHGALGSPPFRCRDPQPPVS